MKFWLMTLAVLGFSFLVASDADDDPLTFMLTERPAGMWIDPELGVIRWAPSADQVGDHLVKAEVADGRGGVAEQSFTVTVGGEPGNHPPTIVSEPVRTVVKGNVSPATSVSVVNAGFEEPALAHATFTRGIVPGWTIENNSHIDAGGVFDPLNFSAGPIAAVEGENVGYVGNFGGSAGT